MVLCYFNQNFCLHLQCPIDFGHTFRYAFWAAQPGTHFYHSHTGHHKVNGHHGGLIVREPNDPHAALYDDDLKEHSILVSDWMHDYGEMYTPGLPVRGGGMIAPDSVLINGLGQYRKPQTADVFRQIPATIYKVRSGAKHRFRFINSASHVCPVQIQVSCCSLDTFILVQLILSATFKICCFNNQP